MVLFSPVQQELYCISDSGCILGQIKLDYGKDRYIFTPADGLTGLSDLEKLSIAERLACLESGKHSIPLQDDD